MLKYLGNIFHRLINPHCQQCKFENDEKLANEIAANQCDSCVMYERQLDLANSRISELLDQIIVLSNPRTDTTQQSQPATYRPIPRGAIKFSDRRAELERLSRGETIVRDLNVSEKVKLPTNAVEMEQVIKASN